MKRFLSFVLVITLVLSIMPTGLFDLTATAATTASGTCGNNLTWTLDSDGVLTISGTGMMDEFRTSPWSDYKNDILSVNIKKGLINIADGSFLNCKNLKSVSIPKGVKEIGDNAFQACKKLASVTIPDGVTRIGDFAFVFCGTLTNITIPDSVTEIGRGAFGECKYLSSVAIPDGVTTIPDSLFYSCERLKSVTIPDSITAIGPSAFSQCKMLKSITVPERVTSIGITAFKGSGLERITIPKSVTKIDYNAFYDCQDLEEIFYVGTQESWNRILIDSSNAKFLYLEPSYICIEKENWIEATCISPGKCTVCGYTEANIGTKHSFGEYVYNNDGTYREDGTKTRTCSLCKETETVTAVGTKVNKPLIDSSEVFKDTSSDAWYKDYVDFAVTYGIFKGTASDTFSPETDMTRAQMVQVFANLSGIDTSDSNVISGFTDVPKGTWYAPAVTWAAQNGIVNGIGDGKFDPDAKITREQMCLMLCNYVEKYLGKTMEPILEAVTFEDDGSISDWAKDAVYKCAKSGLVNGVGDNKFDPKATATRAQGATLFTNFYKEYK